MYLCLIQIIVKHIETLYDELIKNYNQANEGNISPMAQLHNDAGTFNNCIKKMYDNFTI